MPVLNSQIDRRPRKPGHFLDFRKPQEWHVCYSLPIGQEYSALSLDSLWLSLSSVSNEIHAPGYALQE